MDHETGQLPQPLRNRYRVVRALGAGATSRVFLAHDRTLDRAVVIKLLGDLSPEQEARFEREARVLAALRHRNVPALLDHGWQRGHPFLVTPFESGETLLDHVAAHGPLTAGEVIRAGLDLASALRTVHAAGILHRDLKPGNVLLTDDGEVRLLDFGLALGERDARLTGPDAVVGTPGYIAPELLLGGAPGAAADFYALGAVMYYAATGSPAHAGATVREVMTRQLNERVETVPAPHPLPHEVRDLVMRLLHPEPGHRPGDPEVLAVLSRAVAGAATAPAAAPVRTLVLRRPPADPSPRPRAWPALVVGCALAAMLVCAPRGSVPAASSRAAERPSPAAAVDLVATQRSLQQLARRSVRPSMLVREAWKNAALTPGEYEPHLLDLADVVRRTAQLLEPALQRTAGASVLDLAAPLGLIVDDAGRAIDTARDLPAGPAALEHSGLVAASRRLRHLLDARVARGHALVLRAALGVRLDDNVIAPKHREPLRYAAPAAEAAALADELLAADPPTDAGAIASLNLWVRADRLVRDEPGGGAVRRRAAARISKLLETMNRNALAPNPFPNLLESVLTCLIEFAGTREMPDAERRIAAVAALRTSAGPAAAWWRIDQPPEARTLRRERARALLDALRDMRLEPSPDGAAFLRFAEGL